MNYLNKALEFAREGFADVNAIQGLIIALLIAIVMAGYGQILVMALVAVLLHFGVDLVMPVVRAGGDFSVFALPDNLLTLGFWKQQGLLYVGYFIVITVFYILKRLIFRGD